MSSSKSIPQGYFITGSDTGVGKTWIGCQLINQLKKLPGTLKVRKPVESGCQLTEDKQLLPADGLALYTANNEGENLQLVTAYRFRAAISPDRAANLENNTIVLKQLIEAVHVNIKPQDKLVVEGAGGFYSPIAEDGLNADLAKQLGLEVIVVIEDRLGAINQSLLTIRAIESEGLFIRAVILNELHEMTENEMDNRTALQKLTGYPVYSCPFNGLLEAVKF